MATAGSSGEKKVEVDGGEIDHVETGTKHEAADNAFAHGQIESGYEGLTVWQTIKHFKVACLVCGLATFAAATDGYQSAWHHKALSASAMADSSQLGSMGTSSQTQDLFGNSRPRPTPAGNLFWRHRYCRRSALSSPSVKLSE